MSNSFCFIVTVNFITITSCGGGGRGPRRPWIAQRTFEMTLGFFLSVSEKNLQEFLYVRTVQVASFH